MVIVRFTVTIAERRALGFLAGRFSFKSWSTGDLMVPEQALAALAVAGVPFFVQGPATYEQLTKTLGDPAASAVH